MKALSLTGALLLACLVSQAAADDPGPALALFLPPIPPALGTPLPRLSPPPPPPRDPADVAPPELAAYIVDPFYVPLSAQLKHHEIGSDLSFALQSYLTTKAALQTELRAQLDSVREAAPEVRVGELRKFAADQTPRLVQLEASAEALRRTLAARSAAHREFVRWQIDLMAPNGAKGNPPGFDVHEYEIETAMMVAEFGIGPTPSQRRWLRELAGEMAAPITAAGEWAFSPAGSRVALAPSDPVTPELQRLIDDYSALHNRLLADVHRVMAGSRRYDSAPWTESAPRQAALEAELEAKAEAMREIIVKFKDPAALPREPAVPASISPVLARYRADKAALQKRLLQRVDAARQAGPPESAPERIRQAIASFTAENQAKYDALDQSREQMLNQLGQLTTAAPGSAASSPEALTSTFSQSMTQLKSFWEYRDYQSAVFQPGLSPEQRRLLFDGALIKLRLPLPAAIHPISSG